MTGSRKSLANLLLGELLDVSAALGTLRQHSQQTDHRLDRLEQQQSDLTIGLAALQIKTAKTTSTTSTSMEANLPILKHGRRFLPPMLGWLGERLLGLGWPHLLSALVSALLFGRKLLQQLIDWLLANWHWVVG